MFTTPEDDRDATHTTGLPDSGADEHTCHSNHCLETSCTPNEQCPVLRDARGTLLEMCKGVRNGHLQLENDATLRVGNVKKATWSTGHLMKNRLQFVLRDDGSWMERGARRRKLDV